MNRKNYSVILLTVFILFTGSSVPNKKDCKNLLDKEFISNEQEYRAEFNSENKAYFHATFFRNSTYRITACNNESDVVKFSVADHEGNMIFSNSDYDFISFWDFFFENTVDCIITVERTEETVKTVKGTALLLIGFKK
jgi:hypothetical protein